MSSRSFELERKPLSEALVDVAAKASTVLSTPAVPAISEDAAVLEPALGTTVRSGPAAVHALVSTGEEASP
jgi:hypothetical protein